MCDRTLELTGNIVWTKYRWPSIPAIPGAVQMENLTGAMTESAKLKPSETEQSA